MAKLDTYTLTVRVGDEKDYANLSLTVLFEDGDNAIDVMDSVESLIKQEAINMKNDQFLKKIKQ